MSGPMDTFGGLLRVCVADSGERPDYGLVGTTIVSFFLGIAGSILTTYVLQQLNVLV